MDDIRTLTPDEFVAEFAPAKTLDDYFIRNRETGKLELHFSKPTYDALDDVQKQEIKSAFLWGRRTGCWISRAKEPNLWRAERVAKSLGLSDAGTSGERLSFAEQQERKAERAERRGKYQPHFAAGKVHVLRVLHHGQSLLRPARDAAVFRRQSRKSACRRRLVCHRHLRRRLEVLHQRHIG